MQFLKRDPIPHLLSLLTSGETTGGIRSKVLYCLSGALKHNAGAVQRLDKVGGWEALKHALQGEFVPFVRILILMRWQIRTFR